MIENKKTAYFDCSFGASGDMLLAALLDCGLELELLQSELSKLALPEHSFALTQKRTMRCGISASLLEVAVSDCQHERSFAEISNLISAGSLSEKAKDLSLRIFGRIARAESRVHACSVEDVHFHEIGALDSIVDIVGFAIAWDLLGLEAAASTPLPLGSGTVNTRHGNYPVPAPAVVNILQEASAPVSDRHIPFECLTPTGAAILCELARHWNQGVPFDSISCHGYGAGQKDPEGWPNLCRVMLGVSKPGPVESQFYNEEISVIDCNIDDMTPQALAFACNRLMNAGALDFVVLPALMKKGRSGHLLSVLCRSQDEMLMKELILKETSSIGVRCRRELRTYAERSFESFELGDKELRMKLAWDRQGAQINSQLEFDDLAGYASSEGISIKEAQARACLKYASLKEKAEGDRDNSGANNG